MKYELDWEKMNGLIPVVIQDSLTREVLTLAYANEEALQRTIDSGFATFYSRSRKDLWKKGETSGNTMQVVEVRYDCDGDTLLYRVKPRGPACHDGYPTCFYRQLWDGKDELQ